eukprot:COSAG02_NODE_5077_length_4659_cov_29.565570_1_plen_23_part_10
MSSLEQRMNSKLLSLRIEMLLRA